MAKITSSGVVTHAEGSDRVEAREMRLRSAFVVVALSGTASAFTMAPRGGEWSADTRTSLNPILSHPFASPILLLIACAFVSLPLLSRSAHDEPK